MVCRHAVTVDCTSIIKFTTLFGLLAVELAVGMDRTLSTVLAIGFFAVACFFVWRSFYKMRIRPPLVLS